MPSVRASGVSAIAHCNSDNLSELKHGSLIPALHKVGLPNDSYGKPLENHRKMMVKWIFMGCTLTYLVCKYTVTLHIWVFIYIYIYEYIYTHTYIGRCLFFFAQKHHPWPRRGPAPSLGPVPFRIGHEERAKLGDLPVSSWPEPQVLQETPWCWKVDPLMVDLSI